MALREYRDETGQIWRVWHVAPGTFSPGRAAALMPGEMHAGWLCFESEREKRRLAPVPPSWEHRPDHELDLMRRAAEPVPRKPDAAASASD